MATYFSLKPWKIKSIKVSNFKSFNELYLELGDFNVLIGANSAGKSNFLQIFQFLKDITNYGLDNAISMQGGIDYLRNVKLGSSKDLSIEVTFEADFDITFNKFILFSTFGNPSSVSPHKREDILFRVKDVQYRFSLKLRRGRGRFAISEDVMQFNGVFSAYQGLASKRELQHVYGPGKIVLANVGGKLKADVEAPEMPFDKERLLIPFHTKSEELPRRTLLLQARLLSGFIRRWEEIIDFSIFDFEPKLSKKGVPITGKVELESDGRNLAIVLKSVLESKENRRTFANLIQEILPFVENIKIEGFVDRSMLFNVKEIYYPKRYLPASLISDGTITTTALILALFFDKRRLTILEEPERNLHPSLIEKIINMMSEASNNKQLIITTHNPEIVRHSELGNLLLISRDENGFSRITRPIEKDQLQTFLKNELDLGEMYVLNLLGD